MFDLPAKITIVLSLIFSVRVYQIYHLPLFTHEKDTSGSYPRRVTERIRGLLASGQHILITGPSGVGKSHAVKSALMDPVKRAGGKEVHFAPCYIDLRPFIQSGYDNVGSSSNVASGSATVSSNSGSENDSNEASPSPKRLTDAFLQEVNTFELSLMKIAHKEPFQWLRAFLIKYLKRVVYSFNEPSSFSTLESTSPYSPFARLLALLSPTDNNKVVTIDYLLQHIVDVTDKYNKMLSSDQALSLGDIVPVVVIDDIHLLGKPGLRRVRDDLMTFLWRHLPSKQSAKVLIVLISSESNASSMIASWTEGKSNIESLLSLEIVGDLSYQEAREYLHKISLHDTESMTTNPPAEGDTSSSSSSSQHSHSDKGNDQDIGSQIQAQLGTNPLTYPHLSFPGQSRMNARVGNETEFQLIFDRYGGYIPDLQRLARAQADNPLEDIHISDRSRLQSLTAKLDTQLKDLSLDPTHLLQVFRTIVYEGISPRGAVSLTDLVDTIGVPEAEIFRMASMGLIEVREGNPVLMDYPELKFFQGEAYVCAPTPLSRESMLRVVNRLEKRNGITNEGTTSSSNNKAGKGERGKSGSKTGDKKTTKSSKSASSSKY